MFTLSCRSISTYWSTVLGVHTQRHNGFVTLIASSRSFTASSRSMFAYVVGFKHRNASLECVGALVYTYSIQHLKACRPSPKDPFSSATIRGKASIALVLYEIGANTVYSLHCCSKVILEDDG
jgi:hypothetical protein